MINIENVSKKYDTRQGAREVLSNVSFKVKEGQHYGILGRNGSGKSTLIRLISGVELPTNGRIQRKMSVSWPMAFTGSFQGSLTGLDNLRFVARVYGRDPSALRPFVEDFAELGTYLRSLYLWL
jgi:capsular polysaccharide transport system ATP-binding protein